MSLLNFVIDGIGFAGSVGAVIFSLKTVKILKARTKTDDSRRRHLSSLVTYYSNMGYRVDMNSEYFKVYPYVGNLDNHRYPVIDMRVDQVDPIIMQAECTLPNLREENEAEIEAKLRKKIEEELKARAADELFKEVAQKLRDVGKVRIATSPTESESEECCGPLAQRKEALS